MLVAWHVQDVAVEDRMKRLLPMLQSGCDFLQRDLLNQHLLDAQDLKDIEDSITCTSAELEAMHRSLLMR